MANNNELDMSLDDIIKAKKASGSRGGARGGRSSRGSYGGRSAGPVRRNTGRSALRAAPYGSAKSAPAAAEGPWQHDLFNAAAVVPNALGTTAGGGIETGTKLYVSNLDFGVSNEDIKELFGEIGDLKRYSVNYDRSGRSKGTAEVVFARKVDAMAALQRYNNVTLDGKPMKIEMIGTNLATALPVAARVGPGPVATVPFKQRAGTAARAFRPRGVSVRGRGVTRGRGRGRRDSQPQKTQEELDAELDTYHADKSGKSDAMES